MNLISCNENCLYQKDGFCNLDCPAELTVSHTGNCCYFKQCGCDKKTE